MPGCITFIERSKEGNPEWPTIGFAETGILLPVVHTYLDEKTTKIIRTISTRHKTKLHKPAHR